MPGILGVWGGGEGLVGLGMVYGQMKWSIVLFIDVCTAQRRYSLCCVKYNVRTSRTKFWDFPGTIWCRWQTELMTSWNVALNSNTQTKRRKLQKYSHWKSEEEKFMPCTIQRALKACFTHSITTSKLKELIYSHRLLFRVQCPHAVILSICTRS